MENKYAPFSLDIPKMGYIMLTRYERNKKKNFIQERIYKYQRKYFKEKDALFTHVEVLGGGADSVRIFFPRTKAIKIDKVYKGTYVKILRPTEELCPDFQNKYRYKVAYFFARLNNLAYDTRGVLSFIIKFIKDSNRLFFCSEGVVWSYQKVYPDFLNGIAPDKVPPAMLSKYGRLEIVWEGYI